jgi:alcohol dehydrogenase
MINETYYNRTIFYFGRDTELNLEYLKRNKYSNILLHYGNTSIKTFGIFEKVTKILNDLEINYFELGGVEENPKSDLVYKGIKLCKDNGITFILAVGGGSVIDSAKAISIGSKYKDDFFDFFLGKAEPISATPLGIVLTNSGAGSETSSTSVISNTYLNIKKAYSHNLMRAEFAILNPENTISVPLYVTTCGIIDSITHILERYFTNTKNVDCSDRLGEALLHTLIKYAYLIQKEPDNYDYRAEIMWACKMATDQLVHLGRKQEWTCHYIAHEIGALTNKSHGEILSVIFPSWMKYVCKDNEKIFLQFAQRIFNVNSIEEGIRSFELFLKDMKMPTTLNEIDFINKDQFTLIANNLELINPSGTIGNLKRLNKNDITCILEMALNDERNTII